MHRLLAAACAAMLLTGSLTACGNPANPANPRGYTAPRSATIDGDRVLRDRDEALSDSRYTAYSDGAVAPTRPEDGKNLMGELRDMLGITPHADSRS